MHWNRPEQVVTALAVAAMLAGSIVLLARRPAPPVRLIEAPQPSTIVVQVDGEVVRPGLYRLNSGVRVTDAIDAAGGPTPSAELAGLNLARVLRDGERVTVPSSVAPRSPVQPRVNVNIAPERDLEELPGIGPALAHRIVEYRQRHGPFHRPEDLLQVEGIGPKLLARIRDRIIVE